MSQRVSLEVALGQHLDAEPRVRFDPDIPEELV